MYLTVLGVVLRLADYGDKDVMMTLLSRDRGLLSVRVRSLHRRNNPLTAACQLLTYGEYTLFEYQGRYSLNEAHVLNFFYNLRSDIGKLALASYFSQVCEILSLEDSPTAGLQQLLLNSIYALSESLYADMQIKSVFELRAACISGFMPQLTCCRVCGADISEKQLLFDVSEGTLLCADCRNRLGTASPTQVPLTPGALAAMRYICLADSRKIFSFKVKDTDQRVLSDASEAFLLAQADRTFSGLSYYKSLPAVR